MYHFFTRQIEGNIATLETAEAAHCAQVLRKQPGDLIHLVDGKGHWYEGVLMESHKKRCVIEIRQTTVEEPAHPAHIHIAIAPTKNSSRLEWFLEKATEIGINRISPVQCQRSERKKIRSDRLEKVLIAAMKQSLKATLPGLDDLQPLTQWLTSLPDSDRTQRFIAYCTDNDRQPLKTIYQPGHNVIILIGPEGDFTPAEIEAAKAAGFIGVSLGPHRLRTETAGMVACHTVNLMNEWMIE